MVRQRRVDNLQEQIKELDLGEDDSTKHYRYQILTNYFNQQTSFNDTILKQVLRLLQGDSDKTMAGSETLDLLRQSSPTDEQFDTVTAFYKHLVTGQQSKLTEQDDIQLSYFDNFFT